MRSTAAENEALAFVAGEEFRPRQITVRAGVPQVYGHLVAAAHEAGIPTLFSANAFARPTTLPSHIGAFRLSPAATFAGFNLSAAKKLPSGLDAALDSAGFVAANRYGCYRWSVQQYYDLVTARDWTWHAAMDYCMEPQVASSKLVRMIRIHATAQGYLECVNEAQRRGAAMPMPVLQGWMPEDYLRCMDLLAIDTWPDLVGLGSVCRRNLGGPDGIEQIVETLDSVLPPNVKLHCFGVKGGAIRELGAHPRLASIDSMAWDFGVRCKQRTGRTQAMRAEAMTSWQRSQSAVKPLPWAPVGDLFSGLMAGENTPRTTEEILHHIVVEWYAENLADHGYEEVVRMTTGQAKEIAMKVAHFGLESLEDSSDLVEMAVYEGLLSRMSVELVEA
ncbi:hypothetical protein [Hydrogenophaga sp. 2FB]|uniref:deazapurine DNA modification protein DpdA family protein n=1 Tax=Hydrogenophaga sp. 2FB TaxID=2502187 RepID=UPI0010F5CEE1|nr:hypothetical protein [Hydrogenophaga sp. 2FB]